MEVRRWHPRLGTVLAEGRIVILSDLCSSVCICGYGSFLPPPHRDSGDHPRWGWPHGQFSSPERPGAASRYAPEAQVAATLRVDRRGGDPQAGLEPRARPGEVRRAVDEYDAALADGRQVEPFGAIRDGPHVELGPVEGEAARGRDDDLGPAGDDLLPGDPPRWFARPADDLVPPARSMISGFQCPQPKGGSSHSRRRTRRGDAPLRRRAISAAVSLNPAMIDSASARRSSRSPTRQNMAKTSASVIGFTLSTCGEPGNFEAASRTVTSLTAQTSHCSCVRIRSGASSARVPARELVESLVLGGDELVDPGAAGLGRDVRAGQGRESGRPPAGSRTHGSRPPGPRSARGHRRARSVKAAG